MSPAKLRTGMFFILTGTILLLNSTGHLAWSYWVDLLWLWPMLLIALGVEKLFTATRAKALGYLSTLILIGTVLWAWNSHARGPDFDEPAFDFDADFSQSYPLDTTHTNLTVDIDFAAGELRVNSTNEHLLDGQFYSRRGRPRVSFNEHRHRAVVRVRPPHQETIRLFSPTPNNRWKMAVTDKLPVRLNIDCDAGRMDLDLTEIAVDRLDLECGASEIDIIFGGKSRDIDAYLDCGASHLDIKIPHGAGLRVRRDIALSTFHSSGIDLNRRGGYHETADYRTAPVRINLEVDAGVSAFRVSYSDVTLDRGPI